MTSYRAECVRCGRAVLGRADEKRKCEDTPRGRAAHAPHAAVNYIRRFFRYRVVLFFLSHALFLSLYFSPPPLSLSHPLSHSLSIHPSVFLPRDVRRAPNDNYYETRAQPLRASPPPPWSSSPPSRPFFLPSSSVLYAPFFFRGSRAQRE